MGPRALIGWLAAFAIVAAPALAQQPRWLPLASDAIATGGATDACAPVLTGRGPPPVWAVANDSSASDGRVLTEVTRDRNQDRFALCVAPVLARDIEVSVRLRIVGGRIDRAAGIAIRVQDASTYYVLRASARENNVRLYRVIGGVATQIAGRDFNVTADDWHSLRLRAVGEVFQISVDASRLFEVSDRAIARPGRVGPWIASDSAAHFERLLATVLD